MRRDPRVEVRERVNVRTLAPGDVEPLADLVVADLSFISLTLVLPALAALSGELLLLDSGMHLGAARPVTIPKK